MQIKHYLKCFEWVFIKDYKFKANDIKTKFGNIAVIGRPNAGKSTFINWILGQNINMVSHKRNATRKRLLAIYRHNDSQMVFIDTPGIHRQENVLGKFMLEESLKALGDADIVLLLIPIKDDITTYQGFLKLNKKNKKHIILLTKSDRAKDKQILSKLKLYNEYSGNFLAIIPLSTKQDRFKKIVLEEIDKYLDYSPFYYDDEYISTSITSDIYKDFIREGIFESVSEEIPYGSDVLMDRVEESETLYKVYASIVVETNSHKKILIGKDGGTIKRIRVYAQKRIETFSEIKVYLELTVIIKKSWSKNKKFLNELGYNMEYNIE